MQVLGSLFAIAKGYIYFLDSSFMNFVMNFMKYGQLLTSLHLRSCNEKSILKVTSLVGVHTLSVTVTQ